MSAMEDSASLLNSLKEHMPIFSPTRGRLFPEVFVELLFCSKKEGTARTRDVPVKTHELTFF